MAFPSVGRGRGRARNLATALSKPGEQKSNKYSSLGLKPTSTALSEVEASLTTCLKSPTQTNIEMLSEHAKSFVTNDEANATKFVDLLCNKCLADRDFATVSGEIASVLVALPVCGVNIRGVLLKRIQKSYKSREEESKSDFNWFLGFATLFCSFFKWLRVNDEPLKPLTGPVYQVLDDLLDGRSPSPPQREEEIETFHNCLLMVAETLENCDMNKMHELFKKVRQTILKKASPKMRCLLMETLEYYASGNWAANNNIKVYYSDLLSDIMATG